MITAIKFFFRLAFYLLGGPVFVSWGQEFGRQAKIAWAVVQSKEVLNIVLIRPSKYDDQTGFVIRDWRGVLPSNTLATLYSLVCDVKDNYRLGANVRIFICAYDEAVQAVRPKRIARYSRLFRAKTLVMLSGVQTNQFARASDLALEFQRIGVQTIVGGFHVSGVLAQFTQDGEAVNQRAFAELGLKSLQDAGVSLFAGEAEGGRVESLLRDFMGGQLKAVYNYLGQPPDITHEPIPVIIPGIGERFAMSHMGTIDACRGCPFNCSYCTIRTVQGTVIRARGVQEFIDAIRVNWIKGIRSYFFTSDNASRDPLWEERFKSLIRMREGEGIAPDFIMQVDTTCYRIPEFVELAARAGCSQVFIGLESVNQDNLKAVNKGQNKVSDYKELNRAFREHNISVHYGYMIGLPNDTGQSIARDIETLIELAPDLVSFFIVVPLPGSRDHYQMFCQGQQMDPDLNAYDSFTRPVTGHPKMSPEEWLEAYNSAWERFYSTENMIRILRSNKPEYYWRTFWNLIWYKYAISVPRSHPMISGFIRLYDRRSRRSTFPRMGRIEFARFVLGQNQEMLGRAVELVCDLTEVWLATREKSGLEMRARELAEKLPDRADLAARLSQIHKQLIQGKFWVLLRWRTVRTFWQSRPVLNFIRTILASWKSR